MIINNMNEPSSLLKMQFRSQHSPEQFKQTDHLFVLIITSDPMAFNYDPWCANLVLSYRTPEQCHAGLFAAYDIIFVDNYSFNQGEVVWLRKVLNEFRDQQQTQPIFLFMQTLKNNNVAAYPSVSYSHKGGSQAISTATLRVDERKSFVFGILRLFAHAGFYETSLDHLRPIFNDQHQVEFQYLTYGGRCRFDTMIDQLKADLAHSFSNKPSQIWMTIGTDIEFTLNGYAEVSEKLNQIFPETLVSIATSIKDARFFTQSDPAINTGKTINNQEQHLELYLYAIKANI